MHIKDKIWAESDQSLHQCAREINFLPGDVSLQRTISSLTKKVAHPAVIMDEYCGTRGLLTQKDLPEEIVGEIEDELSPTARQPEHHRNGEWIIPGNTMISKVEKLPGVDIQPLQMSTTLAGFVLTNLGEIPVSGVQIRKYGFVFTVKEMDRLRIRGIHVRRNVPQTKK